MSDVWKRWEGQLVDNKYPLTRYIAGTNHSAVFLTQLSGPESRQAAIKFISAEGPAAELQLTVWGQVSQLSHPNLLPIFHAGRRRIEDMNLLYVVMEYAEENLAQILPQRPLSPEEARDMLNPVVDVLVYLHAKSFTHTHIKPSNILAIGDLLKVSSDTIFPVGQLHQAQREPDAYDAPESAGSPAEASRPAADAWSLGVTLVEALTQSVPALPFDNATQPVVPDNLPQPFLDVARHSLLRGPKRRWSAAQIAARLSGIAQPAAATSAPAIAASAAAATSASAVAASPFSEPISPLSVPLSQEPAIPLAKLPVRPAPRRASPKSAMPQTASSAPHDTIALPNYAVPLLLGGFLLVIAFLALPRLFRYRADSSSPVNSASAQTSTPSPASSNTAPSPKPDRSAPAAEKPIPQASTKTVVAKKSAEPLAAAEAPSTSSVRSQDASASLAVLRSEGQPSLPSAKSTASNPARGEVLDQVLPTAPEKALGTIHGTFHVTVRVQVDPSGRVSDAALDESGPSQYFANLAEQAARRWQFTSPDVDGHSLPSEWLIRFEFTSSGVQASPTQTEP